MNYTHIFSVCVLMVAGIFCVNSLVHSQAPAQTRTQAAFDYATLTTETIVEENSTEYLLTWNAGINDIIGRSSRSLRDAQRRISAQLGGANASRTNLSVLLTTIGSDGWRLVESNQNENRTVRVFIRPRR